LAARRGYVECGEALLKPHMIHTSSNVIPNQSVDLANLPNYNGECCVHLASMGGHNDFLKLLCWMKADMNVQEGRAGRTALHFAVGSQNLCTIECLLRPQPHGCGVEPNLLDWYGRTPYQLSIINSMNEVSHYMSTQSCVDLNGGDYRSSDFEVELSSIIINSHS